MPHKSRQKIRSLTTGAGAKDVLDIEELLTKTGSFFFHNRTIYTARPNDPEKWVKFAPKAARWGFALFFVDWDICETKNNECLLYIDEVWSLDGVTVGGEKQRIALVQRKEYLKRRDHWNTTSKKVPMGEFDRKLVFGDAPGCGPVLVGRAVGPGRNTLFQSLTITVEMQLNIISSKNKKQGFPEDSVIIKLSVRVNEEGVKVESQ